MKPFEKKEKSDCSASDDSPPQRPKRNTCQKSAGVTNGLLWREETDLKKALYASLQENKRKNWEEDGEENPDDEEEEQNQSSEGGVIENGEEECPKKAKVHAQRKFAQGSTPNSPVLTPQKVPPVNNSSTQLLPYRRPKTEDFLTFLCLRGTSILPPSLDFLNSCSKSDTSSECRSLSPELEEYSAKDPIHKSNDSRERIGLKHENVDGGLPRKIGACKASSKRYVDTSVSAKKSSSKLNKEAVPSKKRKVRDENEDPKVSSKAKSTGLNALREKYKKQRLAADKKKLLPAKTANASGTKKTDASQKSESKSKPSVLSPKNISQKKTSKQTSSSVTQKTKVSKLQKKLAVEKRKSLRSADVRPKRLAVLKKKSPWVRKAKLVPPIVEVESDSSEPEIIHTALAKKTPTTVAPQKKMSRSENICDRLRKKQDAPKIKNRLTSRQILLRKHMQNRIKAKKSVLHSKNVKSKAIVKQTAKQAILKKVRKALVMKTTMSLRKDLQNKRVTRSAKHQIEEMLWSNPEKRSKAQNQKSVASSKSVKKKPNENQSAIVRKPKLSTVVAKNKEPVKTSKTSSKDYKDNLKRKSHSSTSSDIKNLKPSTSKVSESPLNAAKISRRSSSKEEKPGPSNVTKTVNPQQKSNIEINSPILEIKVKPLTQSEVKKESKNVSNNVEDKTNLVVISNQQISVSLNKPTKFTENSKSNVTNELNKVSLKSVEEKDNKSDVKEKDKNDLGSSSATNAVGSDKNVQNNFNLLGPDKTSDKDISNLIELNVNCEEPLYQNMDPCCSSTNHVVKEKNVIKTKDSKSDSVKEVNVNQDHKVSKKNHDKKYPKKSSSKEESKSSKKNPEKEKSVKKDKSDLKSHNRDLKKHSSKERRSSKETDMISDKKNSHKKEASKNKVENGVDKDNVKKNKSILDKNNVKTEKSNHIDNTKSRENFHKKDTHREKSPINKNIKQNNDDISVLSFPKKDIHKKEAHREKSPVNKNTKQNIDDTNVLSYQKHKKDSHREKSPVSKNIKQNNDDTNVLSFQKHKKDSHREKSPVSKNIKQNNDDTNVLSFQKHKKDSHREKSPVSKNIKQNNDDTNGLSFQKKEIHKKDTHREKSPVNKNIKQNNNDINVLSFQKKDIHKKDAHREKSPVKNIKQKNDDTNVLSVQKKDIHKKDAHREKSPVNKNIKQNNDDTNVLSYQKKDIHKKDAHREKSPVNKNIKQNNDDTNVLSFQKHKKDSHGEKSPVSKNIKQTNDDTNVFSFQKHKKDSHRELSPVSKNIKQNNDDTNLFSSQKKDIHKKDVHREKSPINKNIKPSNDDTNLLSFQKKGMHSEQHPDEVFAVKSQPNTIIPMAQNKKTDNDIQQPCCSKDQPKNSMSSSTSNRETDDDSDYDLTLDQLIKLKALKSPDKGVKNVTNSAKENSKNSVSKSKDFKVVNKDFDKDAVKSKKDGESTKHKKDKDSSKSKSHDKEQKSLKKEDKGSKKDPKSLAKLLKKEKLKARKEEKSKHKKDGSSSSKSSKKEGDKDALKSSKKDSEDSSGLFAVSSSNVEHSESKKDKVKKESKLSRSSSCDETKSPKKKKKHSEFKDIEKIKNLISKSSILSELSGFKEFKRRSSSDKSELKKSKKRKKLALLKEKKLSKKLSSKLLRKYSKKKGLKNKKKLKKKELKEMKIADLESKILKSKKQKHKGKNDHHGKDNAEKNKSIEASMSVTSKTVNITSTTETAQFFATVTESLSTCTSNSSSTVISNLQTCSSSTSTVPTYIIESIPDAIPPIGTMSTQISQPISAAPEQYVFSSADDLQTIVSSDFSGVFEETFATGAILLATRDSISQVPVHFIQDIPAPKTMADAATNTGEDDIEENLEIPESLKNDELSVGTQTMTPVGSPSPTGEIQPLLIPPAPEAPPKKVENTEVHNPIPSIPTVSIEITPIKTPPPVTTTPTKSFISNISNETVSVSPKPKRRSSFAKKSKTQSILLPEGQPFPLDSAKMVSAPVYYPTAEEFLDPLEYICKIQNEAAQFGICKIVPPSSFKPECKVNDDMRFTAHNQYLHKMLNRWGPNVKHTACIKKHLKSQKVKLEQAPLIGGIELDISRFYHTVQQYGGLQQVIEKKKWQRVADTLRVPKTAQDRVTKLYDAYCKYLVSYDTLPKEEKEKLEKDVMVDHERHIKLQNSPKDLDKEDDDFEDEENTDCVSKGRSMSLSNFFRIARNTMNMWFKNAPSPDEVEHEYWKVVTESQQHVVVHAGNIDSSVYQSGFACNRNSPFAKHPWNLKILTNNSGSILRCMGPVSGVTIPTLHVGMLFTTGCWYRDPHSLPWIEYLHTGASKIWYSIPAKGCEKFRESMKKIMPEYCTNNPIWLPSDTAMVPPELLVKHGASLSRTIQNSGQFVVIFPESFTSTICCGYCVSESVYFAPKSWLDLAVRAFQDIQSSCEPPAFSLERLLFSIANDPKTHPETLQKILPLIQNIRVKDIQQRLQLSELGVKQWERLPLLDVKDKKKKSRVDDECEQECETCRTHCYVSMVICVQEDTIYCLPHALEHIPKKNLKSCKLMYRYDEKEFQELETKINEHITTHLAKLIAKKKSPKKKLPTATTAPEK